ncbi:MAG: cytochrome c maturation protein CcmE [Hyphomonadaceae bacterium]|nr:cytochrome c maturation protein CcmE [Hyphomonadaceae bacterium]
MRKRNRRLIVIGVAGVMLAGAAALALIGLRDSVVYFYAPSELAQKAAPGERVRIGGLVQTGTVARDDDGALVFAVSDGVAAVPVRYMGQAPDLFREGQGVVCEGRYAPGAVFTADRVLAKHDETYMPREVVEAMKARGEWRGGTQTP